MPMIYLNIFFEWHPQKDDFIWFHVQISWPKHYGFFFSFLFSVVLKLIMNLRTSSLGGFIGNLHRNDVLEKVGVVYMHKTSIFSFFKDLH